MEKVNIVPLTQNKAVGGTSRREDQGVGGELVSVVRYLGDY
jgi:hypothetical protein